MRRTLRKGLDAALRALLLRTAVRDGAAGAAWPETVVVTGFFKEGFGIGRAAELTAAALEARGFQVVRHDARPALRRRAPFSETVPGGREAAWIIQLNAPEMVRLLAAADPRSAPGGPRIGYWAWELPVTPPSWAEAAALVDQVWAPSDYAAASFRCAGGRLAERTRRAPHPLKVGAAGETRSPRRFLVQADGRSSLVRKNPAGAIAAFRNAFPDGGAELVVKTQHLADAQRALLADAIGEAAGVRWVDGTLPQPDMDALLDSIDGVLSPHRAEGYGLALAEAALRGRAPVATGWSGNMDFMQDAGALLLPYALTPVRPDDEVYGAYADLQPVWADPDLDAAAQALQRLVDNPDAAAAGVEAVRRRLSSLEALWDDLRPRSLLAAGFASESLEG